MKSNIIKAFIVALMLPAAIAMTSCKEEFDSKELSLYVNTEIQPINQIVSTIAIEIPKTGDRVVTVSGQDSLTFTVKATRPLPAAATCTFGADPRLLDAYNKANGTKAVLLPAEYYKVTGTSSIKAGEMVGYDSVTVELIDLGALNADNMLYVLPLSIVSISSADKGLSVSSNRSAIYAIVNVRPNKFNMTMATEADLTGTISAKSNITVTGASTPGRLNDGATTPGWNPSQFLKPNATFEFTKSNTFIGFRTWPDYSYPRETVKNCGIEISDDGKSWIGQGYVELPATEGTSSAPVWRYTKFDEPVTAKYIRLTSLSSYDNSYSGLSEVEFYVQ